MPRQIQYIEVPVVDGVNYVMTATDNVLYYYITGTVALTSNWSLTIGAGAAAGMRCHIQYDGNVTLGGNHLFILGTQIDDDLATKDFEAFAFYNGTSWTVRFFPDWEESGFIETSDIADDAVTNDKLNTMTQGTVKVGGAGGAPTDLDAKTSGQILIGDGTDLKSVPVSGDIAITSGGAVTIAADAVTNTKLANITRGYIKVGGIADAPTDLNAKTNGYILIGDGTDVKSVAMTGDVTITNAGVTTVNPALLPNAVWEVGTGANSVQTIGTGCDASGDKSVSCGENTTASNADAFAEGNATTASNIAAHSEGSGTIASGQDAHAQNTFTIASALSSHSQGYHSVAHLFASSAYSCGKFNINGDAQQLDVQLKKLTTDATPAYMLLGDGATEIAIPTDCTANIDIRVVAVQTAGAAGTIGDSFMQNIKLCAKNIAGVSSVVTHNGATLANYSVVAGDVLYELSSCDAAFGGTAVASVSANKLHITVTGENNKSIQWVAYVSMVWTGYRNFSI